MRAFGREKGREGYHRRMALTCAFPGQTVIPAQAGIRRRGVPASVVAGESMDPRLRGDDEPAYGLAGAIPYPAGGSAPSRWRTK